MCPLLLHDLFRLNKSKYGLTTVRIISHASTSSGGVGNCGEMVDGGGVFVCMSSCVSVLEEAGEAEG